MRVQLTVNGETHELELEENELLLDVLRDRLGLTGAKRSCDVQVCGACTVLVGRTPVSSCCYLVRDVRDQEVQTVEGFAREEIFSGVVDVFSRNNAFQCGFCAPGFLMTLRPLLDADTRRSSEDIQREFAGNLCRCTGYRAIVDSICEITKARAE